MRKWLIAVHTKSRNCSSLSLPHCIERPLRNILKELRGRLEYLKLPNDVSTFLIIAHAGGERMSE